MSENNDPRAKVKQYEGVVFWDDEDNPLKIVKVRFDSVKDLIAARYELIDLKNTIIVHEDGKNDAFVLIEPSRVSSEADGIQLSASAPEEEEEEEGGE